LNEKARKRLQPLLEPEAKHFHLQAFAAKYVSCKQNETVFDDRLQSALPTIC
jgi:hypothetical protein